MKKKLITVLVAIVLILIVGAVALGSTYMDKYSYGKDRMDMDAYYQVSGEQSAIVLQDEMIAEKALCRNGVYYLDLGTVHEYFNEAFYADMNEKLLLYTTAVDTARTAFNETTYTNAGGTVDTGYVIAFEENEVVYVAMDYVKLYTNFSYDIYDRHLQVYTQWGTRTMAEIKKDTWVREKGGVKSLILEDVAKGDRVEVLEQMETWSKVKTADSVIGYVENKRLTNETTEEETPVTDYVAPEYTSISMDGKVNLGWHAIGGVGGNDTLDSMVAEAKGMNVIAPTWFSLNDNAGNFRNFGTADYVQRAHGMGLQVWGVLDDFNYRNETGAEIDDYQILGTTGSRQNLVKGITDAALSLGLDGINLDFEKVGDQAGSHFVQFVRELSVQCRANGLVLSIANFVPFNFNDYYRLDVQGQVADYVIIMGYDEHWHGSGDPGSVASIDYVADGLDKTLAEVPAKKVVNALPFYTILWKTDGSTVTDSYLTLKNTADFLSRVSAQPQWNEETCQNYAEWTEGTATYQIWIEDLESLQAKLSVMSARNIGGVAVWRLGYGTQEAWSLLQAYTNS